MRKRLPVEAYVEGVLRGDRVILGRAITLTESRLPSDQDLARKLLDELIPHTGKTIRLGITGVPGVGKSTFIETFGKYLTSQNKRVAVLSIDPSSQKTGGSILADKTRMEMLSRDPLAYIRPTASGSSRGGIARNTREVMLLCEAAGYDVIIIETVGVGQSETVVKGLTDFFILLMLAGAGDEYQGIKKGIMEMANLVAINKADGTNLHLADQATNVYRNALHLFSANESGFPTEVLTCSALERKGITAIWDLVQKYQQVTMSNGFFLENRKRQNLEWMHRHIQEAIEENLYKNETVQKLIETNENGILEGTASPVSVAEQILNIIFGK